MNKATPSWAVVATVDEPAVLMQAFAAWHLALGAARVSLFFDRPDDPAADLLEGVPGVEVFRCGADHWQGHRPAKHQVRQVHNANLIYHSCRSDWLLHCDADEYLWVAGGIQSALTALDPATDAAVVEVAERVYLPDQTATSIFAGAFRRPFMGTDRKGLAVFGPDYLLTRRGLTGHSHGKAFVRCGRPVKMWIHRPRAPEPLVFQTLPKVTLLHFDGLTPTHWVEKLVRKADAFHHHGGMVPGPHRQAQIDALLSDASGGYLLHDRLKRVGGKVLRNLQSQGLLLQADFDPTPYLPHGSDLSSTAFDRHMRADNPLLAAHLARVGRA